ncbi:NADP-dependent oxidoreductase [Massilia violaceinigra]|uniref:NADP-dependent oxidoreductase n=1 Tax=Massilia violaceinigra TaxID=2045208 RepID=A0ABY4A3L4_9BURK|nr:zinc-binding dehydrogenase [Massilia violaceinigra]UOD29232.1 NADP-dependent oxidoreductase [Massilia violaceinigra]
MKIPTNRQIVLAARPDGNAKVTDFNVVSHPRPIPGDGEVLFRNTLISLDPYQRNLMGNASSELPLIDIGQPMPGPTIAVVAESMHPDFAAGAHVVTWSGWQEYGLLNGAGLRKIDPAAAPMSAALSVLGHTGLTAWVGLNKFLDPLPGGTFVVTAAAGSVGSVVAQLAKLRGQRVVGIAGGAEKVRYLKEELGLADAVDYKAPDFAAQLARALPNGIGTLFENVGGHIFEALMPYFNMRAQIVICGAIAQYGFPGAPEGPDRLPELLKAFLYRFVVIRGFALPDHFDSMPDFLAEVAPLVAAGKIKYGEHFVDGFENIPAAFLQLFDGGNKGKLIARIAAP